MKQAPKEIVTADEIIDYIRDRKVSEEAAYGIKLLRRAAETIAWQDHVMRDAPEAPESTAGEDLGHDAQPFHDETLEQVALALGADFYEKHPETYSLHDVLEHIKEMHQTVAILNTSNLQLQQTLDEIDNQSRAVSYGDNTLSYGEDQACASTDDTAQRHTWMKDVTNFAHKVYGYTMAEVGTGAYELRKTAEDLIARSPAN